jgi:hypothetical protein
VLTELKNTLIASQSGMVLNSDFMVLAVCIPMNERVRQA